MITGTLARAVVCFIQPSLCALSSPQQRHRQRRQIFFKKEKKRQVNNEKLRKKKGSQNGKRASRGQSFVFKSSFLHVTLDNRFAYGCNRLAWCPPIVIVICMT